MSERDAVLFANAAFYAAFSNHDVAAMDEVWSASRAISCIHPGWSVINGRDDVLKSWHGILRNAKAPTVKVHNERVEALGDLAVVTCVEELNGQQYLAATNIFAREGSVWRLIHHQAGPANVDPQSLEPSEDDRPHGPMN